MLRERFLVNEGPCAGLEGELAVGTGRRLATARLFGLDAERARHALGLAATQATGLGVAEPASTGDIARGKAAFDALEGAALARAGFTSAPASIEGRRGLIALMSVSSIEPFRRDAAENAR